MRTTSAAVAACLRAATAATPREACGLLAGRIAADGSWSVHEYVALPNRSADDDAFAIDPIDFLQAEHRLRARGLLWLGFAHSHPCGPPRLSRRDGETLWREGLHWLVAPDAAGRPQLLAFVHDGVAAAPVAMEYSDT